MVVRGDPDGSACCSTGIELGDYMANNFVLRHADIQGMHVGVHPSTIAGWTDTGTGTQTIEDSHLQNETNIAMTTLATSAYRSDWIPARTVLVKNVKFGAWRDEPLSSIGMWFSPDYELAWETANLIQKDQLFVTSFNQIPGDDFEVFYNEQHPRDYLVPQTDPSPFDPDAPRLLGSPEAGLNNTENWNKYGIAIAGAVTPCTTTRDRDGIYGFVCVVPPPR
jgi:hypothetical protein